MSIDPLDRPQDQQPVPGQDQNPNHSPDPDFVTDNPDVQRAPGEAGEPSRQPDTDEDQQSPGGSPGTLDPEHPGLGNPLP